MLRAGIRCIQVLPGPTGLPDRKVREVILSDGTIAEMLASGMLVIDPLLDRQQIQPSSVDLRLDGSFRVFVRHNKEVIDPFEATAELTEPLFIEEGGVFILHPGEFVLANTIERVELPGTIAGQLGGKSSLGRLGLVIHATAGFIDPGFKGTITLELSNVAMMPIKLRYGMKIAQISFWMLDRHAQRPYGHPALGSKYMDQTVATASEYGRNKARP